MPDFDDQINVCKDHLQAVETLLDNLKVEKSKQDPEDYMGDCIHGE